MDAVRRAVAKQEDRRNKHVDLHRDLIPLIDVEELTRVDGLTVIAPGSGDWPLRVSWD